MAGNSPSWKKPSDVMMLHRRKRKAVVSSASNVKNKNTADTTARKANRHAKRRNPFGCSPRKHARVEESAGTEDVSSNRLLDKLDETLPTDITEDSEVSRVNFPISEAEHLFDDLRPNRPTAALSNTEIDNPQFHVTVEHGAPPVDWSLKRKLRFVSDRSFSWCSPLKTSEEATGVSHFVRCHGDNTQTGGTTTTVSQSDFHKCCMLWVHPHLPWINLFPRIITDNKLGVPCAALQGEKIQKSLMSSWSESFTSVFHLVRAQCCPYFYLCTHQFTVLFRSAGVSAHVQMNAIITPTSRGFRTTLSNEGIEFTLPLCSKEKLTNHSSQSDNATDPTNAESMCNGASEEREDEEEEDIANTDDGAQTWLEDLGLDKSQYRCLQPSKVQFQQDDFRTIDGRAESTVVVCGPQTLALFNLLLNCRSCVSATGSQAGLPPTILAPVAFSAATLNTLKVKQCAIKQQTANGTVQAAHVLEITGPILPHTVDALHAVLSSNSQGNYTCTASIHEPTVPFNTMPASSSEAISSDVLCGVPKQHAENLVRVGGDLGRQAIREVVCSHGKLHWTV